MIELLAAFIGGFACAAWRSWREWRRKPSAPALPIRFNCEGCGHADSRPGKFCPRCGCCTREATAAGMSQREAAALDWHWIGDQLRGQQESNGADMGRESGQAYRNQLSLAIGGLGDQRGLLGIPQWHSSSTSRERKT